MLGNHTQTNCQQKQYFKGVIFMSISYQERYKDYIEYSTPKNIEELHIYMFCQHMLTQLVFSSMFILI